MTRKIDNKVGEIRYNNCGTKMEIIEYRGSTDFDVKLYHNINGREVTYIRKNTSYSPFYRGMIQSPYDITIRGFGYLGKGKYSRNYIDEETGKITLTREFKSYEKMIMGSERDGSSIYDKWINFQEFGKWYNSTLYPCNEKLVLKRLSKDIAGPRTCVIIPQSLAGRLARITGDNIETNKRFILELQKWEDIIPIKTYNIIYTKFETLIKAA